MSLGNVMGGVTGVNKGQALLLRKKASPLRDRGKKSQSPEGSRQEEPVPYSSTTLMIVVMAFGFVHFSHFWLMHHKGTFYVASVLKLKGDGCFVAFF